MSVVAEQQIVIEDSKQNKISPIDYKQEVAIKEPKNSLQQTNNELTERDVKGVDINFTNIQYKVQIKVKDKQTGSLDVHQKTILDNISGICKQGQVTAIMGASGAGKTSLLNILAKRIGSTKTNSITGDIMSNNQKYSYEQFSEFATYVMQDDRLTETLTVRESLLFAARLKVVGTPKQQEERVDNVIRQLRLEKCQNTLIGGKFLKGVSGGERKRTSIAFEIISNPQVLLLDEPTSGLDSFTAFLVVNSLKKLAKEDNKTIIFTIHQPSSDIWALFDRVMLLVNGKFIYQGQGGQPVVDYFNRTGFVCPMHSNPADYLMSIMHKEQEENRKNYAKYFQNYGQNLLVPVEKEITNKSTNIVQKMISQFHFCQQIKQIYLRTFKTMMRNPILFKARIGQTIFIALFISALYYQLEDGKNDPSNMRAQTDFTGFFFFQSVNMMMLAMMPMVLTFPEERAVFLKEENGKYYSIGSYFIGRTVLEFPFLFVFPFLQSIIQFFMVGLTNTTEVFFKYFFCNILISLTGNSLGLLCGSAFSDPKVASGMMPVFIMPFMLFAGFFSNRDNLWAGVSWIEYLSPFKYGFDAHIHNEFEETYFRPKPLDVLNLEIGYWNSCFILIGMFIGYRVFAFTFLWFFKKKLQ